MNKMEWIDPKIKPPDHDHDIITAQLHHAQDGSIYYEYRVMYYEAGMVSDNNGQSVELSKFDYWSEINHPPK